MKVSGRTPVVIADSAELAAKAAQLGFACLTHTRRSLTGADGTKIALPSSYLSLDMALQDGVIEAWNPVLSALAQRVAPDPIFIVPFGHKLQELFLLADSRKLFPYALYFPTPPAAITPLDYSLLTNARLCIFRDDQTEESFRKLCVVHYHPARLDGELSARLASLPALEPPPPPAPKSDKLRVLIVAYFSGPCRTVGVQRINYWAEMLEDISGGRIEAELATATPWAGGPVRVHAVPDHHVASLADPDGSFPPWAAAFAAAETAQPGHFRTLSYYWRYALEKYFDRRSDRFDAVIISGNPFAVFDFAAYAKRRWYAKVILDYRDPFANNPRIGYTAKARQAAAYLERGYNFQADLIAVVNDVCRELAVCDPEAPIAIVPNGYDERVVPEVRDRFNADGRIHFVHAGSFYHSPAALIKALDPAKHRFHSIGGPDLEAELQALPQVTLHDRLPYTQVLEEIGRADCGVVFVSAAGFETPTKVFDYLAHGLDVLVVTQGEPETGALASLLKDYEGLYWAENTASSLAAFLATYTPAKQRHLGSRTAFSRRASTETLVDHLIRLCARRVRAAAPALA